MPSVVLNFKPRKPDRNLSGQRSSALKIVAYYILFGCLWILFSDELLSSLIAQKDLLTRWQTIKGWTFIIVTAVMLYLLISRSLAQIQRSSSALATSEARFRRIVESNMIGIIFWKSDGQIVDANDAYLKTVGYTREELIEGKVNWIEMTPPEYRRHDAHAGEERKAFGRSIAYEKEYIRNDAGGVFQF